MRLKLFPGVKIYEAKCFISERLSTFATNFKYSIMKKELYIAPQAEQLEIESESCFATSSSTPYGISTCGFEDGNVSTNEEEW